MSTREAAWIVAGSAAHAVAATYPLIVAPVRTFAGTLADPPLTAWTLAWDADRNRHGFEGIWDAPLPAEPAQTVPATAIHVQASHSPERLPRLFDGEPDSRWISSRPQIGDEWLQLDFDRARDIAEVHLQLGARRFGDYPRLLEIDAVEDGRARSLFGTVLPQIARGLIVDGAHPWTELALPPNRARSLRLRQLATARTLFWSVHELRLRERI